MSEPEYRFDLLRQADSLYRAGDYSASLACYAECERAGRPLRDRGREEAIYYAFLLNNIALCQQHLCRFTQALENHREALAAGEDSRAEYPAKFAKLLCDYATCHIRLGRSAEAIRLYEQALPLLRRAGDSAALCILFNNLAAAYDQLADYDRALAYFDRADSLHNDSDLPPSYRIVTFNNRARLYTRFGNYTEATEYYARSRSLTHPGSREYTLITFNIADLASRRGRYDEARRLNDEALSWSRDAADSLTAFRQLGQLYAQQGNLRLAMRALAQARTLAERLYPARHPRRIAQEAAEALACETCGQTAEALARYREAWEQSAAVFGKEHPRTVALLYGAAKCALLTGDYPQALRSYDAYLSSKLDFLSSRLSGMSEAERTAFWRESREGLLAAPLFCHLSQNYSGEFAGKTYDVTLLTKRMLFDAAVDFERLVRESGDSTLCSQYEQMRDFRMELQQQLPLPVERRTVDCQALDSVASAMEKDLRRELQRRGIMQQTQLPAGWRQIAARLPKRGVAVEFTDFDTDEGRMYAALVLPAAATPQMIPLCRQQELLDALGGSLPDNRAAITACYGNDRSRKLYDLIWKPLEKALQPGDTVFFAPSGLLHNLPLEYLTCEAGIAADRYGSLRRVSSSLSLLARSRTDAPLSRAVVYGAVNYLDPGQQRGVMARFDRMKFGVQEVTSIRKALRGRLPVRFRSGTEASESDFKEMRFEAAEHALLHFSTHGFYLPDSLAGQWDYFKGMEPSELKRYPLMRSGLAMAGANNVWSGREFKSPDADDGILTAQEIAMLDLRGVSLVVLAACQTGQGDLTSDGVVGLQQAFKRAGAGSLLVSLWSTDDECTSLLTGHFYRLLMEGKNRYEALDEACRIIRENPRFGSPYYWAAFVLTD